MAEILLMEEAVRLRLITETKVHLQQADKSLENAERHYKAAGEKLRQLKMDTSKDIVWDKFVRQQFGFGERWARWLMDLAAGKTTLEKMRQGFRERQRRVRDKKREREREARITKNDPATKARLRPGKQRQYAEPPLEERWQYSLANLCGDIIAIAPYWCKEFPGWEEFDCPSHIKTLLKDAATALASITTTVTVGDRKKR